MREFQLVGGPFDGAHGGMAPTWNPVPADIYVKRDPESHGKFGLAAWRKPQPGSIMYRLTEARHQEYIYVHADVDVPGGVYDWAEELLSA